MKHSGNLTVTLPGDREIALSRVFDAPRSLDFEAYTTCEYVTRRMGAFGGWSLDVCEIDLRVGGSYRYLWYGKGWSGARTTTPRDDGRRFAHPNR